VLFLVCAGCLCDYIAVVLLLAKNTCFIEEVSSGT